jgi:hypothetical protein
MPVIWSGPGERWNDPALAVPCPTCKVEIGKPCEAISGTVPTHRPRTERAEVFGFRLAGTADQSSQCAAPKPPPHLRTADLFGGI